MMVTLRLRAWGHSWWLVVGATLAVVVYSSFSWGLPLRYNSPDEAANAFFAGRVARGEALVVPTSFSPVAQEPIVHPRSTQIVSGHLAPVSFFGLPLIAGSVARALGAQALPYVTPFAALLGLTCFYLMLKELFDRRTAIISTVLLAALPAFWYYHSRSLFHNALFFDLIVLAGYATLRLIQTKHWSYYFLTGLALGAALAVRTSEVFWLLAAGGLWLGLMRHEVNWRYLWLTAAAASLAFSPILVSNYHIYGSVFSFGYRVGIAHPLVDLGKTVSLVRELVLPFGFHPSVIAATVRSYLVSLTWWWALLTLAGLVSLGYSWRSLSRVQRAFAWQGGLACVWLIVLYGSWRFNDNPDPAAVTLGTSYVRYWLPLYAFMLWPAGRLLSQWWSRRWGRVGVIAVVGLFVVLSLQLVWWQPAEGLAQIRANVTRFNDWGRTVQQLTEPNSVIVSGITDKLFWPERQVIYALVRPQDYAAIRRLLAAGVPVYNFHPTWLPADLSITNKRLSVFGLGLQPVQYGFQDFTLYKFTVVEAL